MMMNYDEEGEEETQPNQDGFFADMKSTVSLISSSNQTCVYASTYLHIPIQIHKAHNNILNNEYRLLAQ